MSSLLSLLLTSAQVSSLLHHIEQSSENINDEEAVRKVVPLKLQGDTGLYEKIVEVSCLIGHMVILFCELKILHIAKLPSILHTT